jgi:hypothetical protein
MINFLINYLLIKSVYCFKYLRNTIQNRTLSAKSNHSQRETTHVTKDAQKISPGNISKCHSLTKNSHRQRDYKY